MIRTVKDLRRALELYPDEYPIDETGREGLVLDNHKIGDTYLTMKTYTPDETKGIHD